MNHALHFLFVSRITSSARATELDELDRQIFEGKGSNRKLTADNTSHSEDVSNQVLSKARSNTPSEPVSESFEGVSEESRPSVGGGSGKVTFNLPHLGASPSKV
jgi:hypothetical protein